MNSRELKRELPRTWGAFFERHGSFTPIQLAAIPLLLSGENVGLCSGTASGKTEAALAPLIERHLPPMREPGLALLYLLPTRALINDLSARLAAPLDRLRVSCAVKTRDDHTFDPERPADILLTTPESLDSLLAAHARALIAVRAIVLDELHTFDGTPRGDHLRVLLNRVRQVRAYAARTGDMPDGAIQYAALSATLPDPEIATARYFPAARVVESGTARPVVLEKIALEADSPAALLDCLNTFRQRGWRKAIAFCNTRAEVEACAAAVRAADSPFGEAVFVHYSNLERERRREIEDQFAHAEAALCFASSTLELGIDIGSIDATLLIGAPGSTAAFTQRIGRANRREPVARAVCFYRTPLESRLFDALLALPSPTGAKAFRPSVAVQQIFSLLLQSPTGAVRLKPLADVFEGMLAPADLEAILGHLQATGYLNAGRAGEWRAGEKLNRLADVQAMENTPLSLYSNTQNDGAGMLKIRNQHTQRVVARVDRRWLDADVLTLEGRPLAVEWNDGEALWVSAYQGSQPARQLSFRSGRQMLSFELAQQLPAQLGLNTGDAPLLMVDDGWGWFHWLGDIYGHALLDLLRFTHAAGRTPQPGLCLLLPEEPRGVPVWEPAQVIHYLGDQYRRYERWLALGAYQHLLPPELRRRAVIEQFNVPRFIATVDALRVVRVPEAIAGELREWVAQT